MEASGLRHAPAALDQAKNTVPTEQDARWVPESVWTLRGRGKKNLLPLLEFETAIFHCVA